jgi:phosphoribosyl 1,2-cyclic phosphodiesterase
MFQTSVIASGSKGNSILVQSRDTALIIDAGISLKRIFAALDALGVARSKIQAVIVSHEHSDHTLSAGSLSRALQIPVYISPDTYSYSVKRLGNLHDRMVYFEVGRAFEIGDILVAPFPSSHDAIESSNFYLMHEDRKLGIALDLGHPTRLTEHRLADSHTLILESNHDVTMLLEGPYDWPLKMRVKSKHGHLSNVQAVELVSRLMHPRLENLILAHLSETNNCPELAKATMQSFLDASQCRTKLIVASQTIHTPLIDI